MRRAVFGARPSSDLIAAEVRERAWELEDLPEQGQRDDDDRGLEVDRHPSHREERVREHAGRHGRDDAVCERRRGSQTDQRPHVWTAASDRLHGAHEERPTGPEDDRHRQGELNPALRGHVEPPELMAEHRQYGNDDRERQGPPEAPPEVRELGVLFVLDARQLGLERHPALRARSRVVLPDFRMHRARVDGGCRGRRGGRGRLGGQVLERAGGEFRPALLTAEEIGPARMLVPMRRLRRDGHAAHGILQ
jgi:hypothetical protein